MLAPGLEYDLTSGRMLAYSPAAFKKVLHSEEVRQHSFDMIKDGVSMTTDIWEEQFDIEHPLDSNIYKQNHWLLPLNCHSDASKQSLAIVLTKTGSNSYTRSAYPSIREIDDLALERDGWKLCREQSVDLDDNSLSSEQSSGPFNSIQLSIRACSCIRIRSAHSVLTKSLRTLAHFSLPQSTELEFRELPLRLFNNSFDRSISNHEQLLIILDYQSSPDTVLLSLLLAVDYQPSSGVSVMMSQCVNSDDGYGAFVRASTEVRAHSRDTSVFRPGNESEVELVARVTPVPMKRSKAQDPFSDHESRIDIFDHNTSGACSKETTLEHLQKLTRRFSQRSADQLLRLIYFQSSSIYPLLGYAFLRRYLLGDITAPRLPHNHQLSISTASKLLLFCALMYGPALWILNIMFNILWELYQYHSNNTSWAYWILVAYMVADISATMVPVVVPSLTNSYNWYFGRRTLLDTWGFGALLLSIVVIVLFKMVLEVIKPDSVQYIGLTKQSVHTVSGLQPIRMAERNRRKNWG